MKEHVVAESLLRPLKNKVNKFLTSCFNMCILINCFFGFVLFFFKLGFTPCNAEQPLQGMELQKKKQKKIKVYRK